MTPARRLWVIDPSVTNPEHEGVAEILDGWGGASRLFRPALSPGDGPDPGTGYATDGIVLMGSAVSVHDDLPWLEAMSNWLRPVLSGAAPVPLLGICFGHQLIAHLSGGDVGWVTEDRSKLVGVATSDLAGGRLVHGEQGLRVVVSHREEVKRIPAGYRVCATRSDVAVDGLEHERLPLFSFQFHPEARGEFAGHAGIPQRQIDDRVREDGGRLLGAYRRLVAEVARA